jgi:hypothetical protein
MTGKLIPCKEVIYTNMFYNFTTALTAFSKPRGGKEPRWWTGKSGFCRKCEDEFKVTVLYPYLNDPIPSTVLNRLR